MHLALFHAAGQLLAGVTAPAHSYLHSRFNFFSLVSPPYVTTKPPCSCTGLPLRILLPAADKPAALPFKSARKLSQLPASDIPAAFAASLLGAPGSAPRACPAGHGQPSGGRLPLVLPDPVVRAQVLRVQSLYGLHDLQIPSLLSHNCV